LQYRISDLRCRIRPISKFLPGSWLPNLFMTIPSLPHAKIGMIVGLLEQLNDHGGKVDIYKLSQSLHFELDDLIPITEAAELLGFAKIESGDLEFADLGRKVIDGDENAKKAIFRRQIILNIPLVNRIITELEKSDDHRIGRERILEFLQYSFSPQESQRQLDTVVDWARYAELFDYDPDADEFFLPETAETA
jgi:NitT/TauT family transport system ATP-binding protein